MLTSRLNSSPTLFLGTLLAAGALAVTVGCDSEPQTIDQQAEHGRSTDNRYVNTVEVEEPAPAEPTPQPAVTLGGGTPATVRATSAAKPEPKTMKLLAPKPSEDNVLESVTVGQEAPGFTLASIQTGEPVSLADMRGKWVMMNMWVSWCPACRESAENFTAPLHAKYGQGEAAKLASVGVGLSVNDTLEAQKAIAGSREWVDVFDADGVVQESYGVVAQPVGVLIDPTGKVATYGYLADKDWRAALAAYIEQEVSSETTMQ